MRRLMLIFVVLFSIALIDEVHSNTIDPAQSESMTKGGSKAAAGASQLQNSWALIGEKWYYSRGTINPDVTAYCTFESVLDTVINGVSCKKLVEKEYNENGLVRESHHYMYSNEDSVFFYKEDEFHLLYDFSADKGDVISLGYYETYDGSPLEMEIDSVGSLQVNGSTRKVQYVTCGDGLSVEFNGQVVEGIGNTMYMFPIFEQNMKGPLRCYFDESGNRFVNPFNHERGWNREDCDQIMTSSHLPVRDENEILVFPVPAKDFVMVRNAPDQTGYFIYDVDGCLLKQGMIANSPNRIDLSEVRPGVYILKLRNGEFESTHEVIRK